ncbi:serine peptidase inhibitor, Kazal type 4 isoform X2 [Trichomycterus rosablanca]
MSMFVFAVLVFLTAGSQGDVSTQTHRKPACSGMTEILACPMNFAPVCGTDGSTYANECALCVQRLQTKTNILIAKDGNC